MTILSLLLKELVYMGSITVVPRLRLQRLRMSKYLWWKKATRFSSKEFDIRKQMVDDSMLLDTKFLDVFNGYLHSSNYFLIVATYIVFFIIIKIC